MTCFYRRTLVFAGVIVPTNIQLVYPDDARMGLRFEQQDSLATFVVYVSNDFSFKHELFRKNTPVTNLTYLIRDFGPDIQGSLFMSYETGGIPFKVSEILLQK
jgi:hypothetical protein